jgi:hypothetical protein
MWKLVALVALAGCDNEVTFGEVQVIDLGTGRTTVRACIDAGFLSCEKPTTPITVTHDGVTTDMPYDGFFFPENTTTIATGDREAPFTVSDGHSDVVMTLPKPFDLVREADGVLGPGDKLVLHWDAAGAPMIWFVNFSCTATEDQDGGGGFAAGETIDDDGSLVIEADQIMQLVDHEDPSLCEIVIELNRAHEGTVESGFHAERGTAIERRELPIELVR